jgi:hypothetical protein
MSSKYRLVLLSDEPSAREKFAEKIEKMEIEKVEAKTKFVWAG